MSVCLDRQYKTSFINNRRYLGNKYKLLSFITKVVEDECGDIESVADIFAGTGAVSSAFDDKIVITNDLLYSNYICNYAWFGSEPYNEQIIIDYIIYYNSLTNLDDNYMTDNFADTYFSREDCAKIGFIREDIESQQCLVWRKKWIEVGLKADTVPEAQLMLLRI